MATVAAPSTHPHDDTLLPLEDGLFTAAYDALRKIARATTRGVSADNPQLIISRTQSIDTWQPLRDIIAAWLMKAAAAGVTVAADDIEQRVLSVKATLAVKDAPVLDVPDGLTLSTWEIANDAAIAWAMDYANIMTSGLAKRTSERIQRLIADWIQNAEPMGTLVERIMGNGYLYSESRARAIAVTEITRAFAEGNRAAWRESGIVGGNQWLTNRDELVCPFCGPLHGKIALIGGAFAGGYTAPPAHVRCRCWLAPVLTVEIEAGLVTVDGL